MLTFDDNDVQQLSTRCTKHHKECIHVCYADVWFMIDGFHYVMLLIKGCIVLCLCGFLPLSVGPQRFPEQWICVFLSTHRGLLVKCS